MTFRTDDLRIREIKELAPPANLLADIPASDRARNTVAAARAAIHRILHGLDDRLLVVVGPCSIHDPLAARDYAERLAAERRRHADRLELVMRVYFEKPRTTIGWKGLINDPDLDGSFNINKGLRTARSLLLDIAELELPAGTESLDTITPQYIADLISWSAIGARTAESQVHRELASGLSCPVGFKNGTDGNLRVAIDGMAAASQPHHFLSITKGGQAAIVSTAGNEDCHIILRGGTAPNYGEASVSDAAQQATAQGLPARLMIDASHGNSRKQPDAQIAVVADVAKRIAAGERRVFGAMIESNLVAGAQPLIRGRPLVYGQSITDGCAGWDATVAMVEQLSAAVAQRRAGHSAVAA